MLRYHIQSGTTYMLKIRAAQIEALREPALRQFEDDMVLHLQSAFHTEIEDMTEDELRKEIRFDIQKAEKYNIVISTDVSRFIEYIICYGDDFDESPDLKWVSETLNDNNFDGTEKMDRIDELEREIIMT